MTAKQFNVILNRLWHNQREASEALGITRGAVSHYSTGRRSIPEIIIKFMRCIENSRKGVHG